MIKKFTPRKLWILVGLATLLMACEAENMDRENEMKISSANATIESSSLVGTWKIVSMISDVPVNLDSIEGSNTNILKETYCFDPMFFEFREDGGVTTGQAKLDFGANNDEFNCEYGEYFAEYYLTDENNEVKLVINFVIEGTTITESKAISLSTEGEDEYLRVILTDAEVDAADYIKDDPGTTVASDITELELIYKKQQ